MTRLTERDPNPDPAALGVLEALPVGAAVVDTDYRIHAWNAALGTLTGVDPSWALGHDLRHVLPALARPRFELRIEEVLRGAPAATFDSLLHSGLLKDPRGAETGPRVRIGVGPWHDPAGDASFAVIVVEDRSTLHELCDEMRASRDSARDEVVRRQRSESELRQHADHLAAANDELQQFAYMASHDLREPLHKVRMFVGLLEEDIRDTADDETLDTVHRIGRATERLEDLLTESLALLRAGENVETTGRVDCEQIARDAIDDLDSSIAEADAVVELGDLPPVTADAVSVHHLLLNLLSNALKFRHPDRRCRVEIEASRGSVLTAEGELDAVRLVVRDNGIGFDPRYASEIFKPFRRLHGRDRSYHGHGLGLSICRRIVRRHGGQIWAESRRDRGATFHVVLPAVIEEDDTGSLDAVAEPVVNTVGA
ncbi:MAG TPA: ATP-binding protein [Candidatus Krumholzibacteria bacterium]|nr:ATP-binding protein [Candidatus Krumholzibacteria bacterium]